MLSLIQTINCFRRDERGQALTEYGLIIALVSILLVGGLGVLTGALEGLFDSIAAVLNPPATP